MALAIIRGFLISSGYGKSDSTYTMGVQQRWHHLPVFPSPAVSGPENENMSRIQCLCENNKRVSNVPETYFSKSRILKENLNVVWDR
jgi:hypothetical protein